MSMLLPAPFSPMSAWHLALRHRERNAPQSRRRAETLADILEEEAVGHFAEGEIEKWKEESEKHACFQDVAHSSCDVRQSCASPPPRTAPSTRLAGDDDHFPSSRSSAARSSCKSSTE